MSPTSYQAAPPRTTTIAERADSVKPAENAALQTASVGFSLQIDSLAMRALR